MRIPRKSCCPLEQWIDKMYRWIRVPQIAEYACAVVYVLRTVVWPTKFEQISAKMKTWARMCFLSLCRTHSKIERNKNRKKFTNPSARPVQKALSINDTDIEFSLFIFILWPITRLIFNIDVIINASRLHPCLSNKSGNDIETGARNRKTYRNKLK